MYEKSRVFLYHKFAWRQLPPLRAFVSTFRRGRSKLLRCACPMYDRCALCSLLVLRSGLYSECPAGSSFNSSWRQNLIAKIINLSSLENVKNRRSLIVYKFNELHTDESKGKLNQYFLRNLVAKLFGRERSGYENTFDVSKIQDFKHEYSSLLMENFIFSFRVLG